MEQVINQNIEVHESEMNLRDEPIGLESTVPIQEIVDEQSLEPEQVINQNIEVHECEMNVHDEPIGLESTVPIQEIVDEQSLEPEQVVNQNIDVHDEPIGVESTVPIQEIVDEQPLELEQFEENILEESEMLDEDFSHYTREKIIAHLNDLLQSGTIDEIKDNVEELKAVFYKLHKVFVDEQQQLFVSNGGQIEAFKLEDTLENEFKVLYKQYRDQKAVVNEQTEKQKQDNLAKRYEIINKLKELVVGTESVNKTFSDFRELQNQWNAIGMVPQSEIKNVWETYHHSVGMFYDFVKINKELRDLDLKKNLEAKIEICEKAERLLLEESVIKSFTELQKLHDQWREIGPTIPEKMNELWERFKNATTQINKTHQDYFLQLKEQEKKNLDAKTLLCDKIDEILQKELITQKDWIEKTNEIVEFQKIWRTIGYAPRKFNNEVYARFRKSCDEFFEKKREFVKTIKSHEEHNKQLKISLCIQAEALKSSTEWKKTTDELIKLQKEWKQTGAVAKNDSEKLWKRFREACDVFFKTKATHFASQDKEQEINLQKKLEIIERVQNLELSDNQDKILSVLQDIQKEWTEIGFVPLGQKDKIQAKFRDVLNKKFEGLKVDENKKKFMQYRVKMGNVASDKHVDEKISLERTKLHKKMKDLQEQIALLENNIGFFAKSKNADSIIADVKSKIENYQNEHSLIQNQIKLLDEIEVRDK